MDAAAGPRRLMKCERSRHRISAEASGATATVAVRATRANRLTSPKNSPAPSRA